MGASPGLGLCSQPRATQQSLSSGLLANNPGFTLRLHWEWRLVGRVRQPEVGLGLSRESGPALFLRRLQPAVPHCSHPLLAMRMLDKGQSRGGK